jgi:hypothetical protein
MYAIIAIDVPALRKENERMRTGTALQSLADTVRSTPGSEVFGELLFVLSLDAGIAPLVEIANTLRDLQLQGNIALAQDKPTFRAI